MTLPKAILCNGSILLLLFITCVYVYCGPTDQSLRKNESDTLKQTNLNEKSGWLHHERFRRDSSGAVTKCSDSQCFWDKTTFFTSPLRCYCDEACYKIFSDCCPDYEKQCGRQQLLEDKTSVWKCVEYYLENWDCIARLGKGLEVTGVWMISKCPADWRLNELRTRCENVLSNFGYPVEDFIPVVGATGETYRNKHCAVCNGVENYTSWEVEAFTYVIPPDELDLDSKLKFIENNGEGRVNFQPGWGQPWRFCFGRNFKDNCISTNHTYYKRCVEGPVEVVGAVGYLFFKNSACAICNGYQNINYHRINNQMCPSPFPIPLSIVFDLRKASETSTVTQYCPSGTVYDTTLKICRDGYIISSSGKLTNQFLILVWFKLSRRSWRWIVFSSTGKKNFKSAFISRFSLQDSQISQITFHTQSHTLSLRIFVVATFRLTLTPFQSLLMANEHKSMFNVTNQNTAFLELLNFTGNFTISSEENTFIVVKMTSKQLSCYDEKKFQSHEYKIGNGSLVVNIKTGKIFSLEDYTLIEEGGGNITLCRKLLLSDCNEAAFVPLSPDEYVVFPNLTVYHNSTGSVFNFGEYLMSENKRTSNASNTTQNSILSSNSTISVCLPLKGNIPKTELKYSTNTTSYALRILTLIGFSVSIICLMLLLITYGLFQELRAVSGMNLMNLSLSLLLSHLIWLIGTSHFTGTCKVLAIFEHYLFQVSFVAMSVISYHSCYVFSQPFAGRFANKSWRRFIKYSAFVWLAPAIFVAICVTLDKTETFLVDYGTNCWLGTVNAKLYLFLLPLAILLLFNIVTFIRTALSLYRHEKDRPQTLQRKERKQNLLICAKLATLVGFPWLIAFIGVLFRNVEAFQYLFVIFVCLQGLYIGMAFLFNKKTLKLYKDRWNIGYRGNASSYTPAQTFEMT